MREMTSDTSTLVSKGCFAYKGKVKKANMEDYLNAPTDKFIKNRIKLCNQLQANLHVQIDDLRSDLNSKIFDDLITFTASYDSDVSKHSTRTSGEILTAVLITGVNTPDHDVMFSSLDGMLKEKVTPLVARIKSQDCARMAMLVKNIFQQLTHISISLDEEDDYDGITAEECSEKKGKQDLDYSPVKLKATVKRKRAITMSSLVKWYTKNHCLKTVEELSSPNKKSKIATSPKKKVPSDRAKIKPAVVDVHTENCNPPIIVMLEDAENINPNVLQDFISLCSSHLVSLPIVLVLGIATSVAVIHQLLPTSVSSLLCMETFQAPSASSYLTQLMDKIIMTDNMPFKLGPKVFHFLLDIFLYHDFSVLNFIRGFEYSMLEHFVSSPLSILCCLQDEVDTFTSQLTHAQLEDIRRQPAFMRYVEENSDQDQAILLTDDSATKKHLAAELTAMHIFHAKMFAALRFLHCLCSSLPKHPLGKQFRELYSVCLTQNLCKSDGYEQALSLLRMMSCDDLCGLLNLSQETLSEAKSKLVDIEKLHQDVERFIYRLNHIDQEPDLYEKEGLDSEDTNATSRILPQRAKLHELKEKLQSMTSRRRKSPYEQLRNTIFDTLHEHFKVLLVCPMSKPLYEVFYFNNLSAIKDQLKAAPRCSIQRALTLPGKYLNCPCCQCDGNAILPSMPDICVVYKLHLECGTLVNLYDWLQAFVTIITSDNTESKKRVDRNKKPSAELRARFIRAVSELQFLGFIKTTERKTDHVTRLTW